MSDARAVLRDLVAARNARAPERVARVLAQDVGYWDCERGELAGRDAVASALTADDAEVELETLAADGDDAVLELRRGARGRSTEVYRLADGAVVSIKAYFDPSTSP